jgi:hypothetical protein
MQSVLQNLISSSTQSTTGSSGTDRDFIKSFLDKVANGTATAADLENMQSVLQQMQEQFGNK